MGCFEFHLDNNWNHFQLLHKFLSLKCLLALTFRLFLRNNLGKDRVLLQTWNCQLTNSNFRCSALLNLDCYEQLILFQRVSSIRLTTKSRILVFRTYYTPPIHITQYPLYGYCYTPPMQPSQYSNNSNSDTLANPFTAASSHLASIILMLQTSSTHTTHQTTK